MNAIFIGATLDLFGKILVAYTALMVHHRVWQEHKIDEQVFKVMHKERILGFLGISLMIVGYAIQLPGRI